MRVGAETRQAGVVSNSSREQPGILNYFYQGAFEADATTTHLLIGEGAAVAEAEFVGHHIGEFMGVPPTGKEVRVPLCVGHDLRDGEIVEGRVYSETPAFLAQVGASASG